jgi:hypothetical protein
LTITKPKALVAVSVFVLLTGIAVVVGAHHFRNRLDPYIREQAIRYLEQRFDSDVELASLRVSLPPMSALKLVWTRGHGIFAPVAGEGISLRHRGNPDLPPLFVMKRFSFLVDLGSLFSNQKLVRSVMIDGMEINIPPKEKKEDGDSQRGIPDTGVLIEEVVITDSMLRILPKDEDKKPLQFDLHRIRLESAGTNVAMKYDATLTNAKPPGEIQSKGSFGPWAAEEPGDTPLKGDYEFKDADLGVFDGIAGILHSTGDFEGTLDSIEVNGEASVPDFRLKSAGNGVRLSTRFNVLVDGTNGNTTLKPVIGTLGTTEFKTSGAVLKREKQGGRSINLEVTMPNGSLRDLLTLAMKGPPFMEGRIRLKTNIDIPPLSGKVISKLRLDGNFEISRARFLQSKIQDQIDTLSRRGRGQPGNDEIVEVPSGLAGSYKLADEVLTFRSLAFAVRGAGVDLAGNYDIKNDDIDFHGTLKLNARVSETMTGWKRWALKPVNPFFSKQGAGTLLHIQVTGTSKDPHFGLDRRKKDRSESSN